MFDEGLNDIILQDERYAPEAYEFIFHALYHTQKTLNRVPPEETPKSGSVNIEQKYHVSGPELMYGVRDLALRQFGLMARTVFKMWGINSTDDFGNIVFNLIEAGLMSKTDRDNRDDFHNVYDMDEALVKGFQFRLDEDQ